MATADVSPCGWKLVDHYYDPLRGGMQRYLPGTTQTVSEAAAKKIRTRPMLRTNEALHFCERAIDTLMYVTMFDVGTLRLLHVTAVPMPPDGDACFTRNDDCSLSGATALRVDAEVTNAAERATLLTGTSTTIADRGLSSQITTERDYANGVLLMERRIDVCGNAIWTKDYATNKITAGYYVVAEFLHRRTDGSIPKHENEFNFAKACHFLYSDLYGAHLDDATRILFLTTPVFGDDDSTCEVASSHTVRELRERMGMVCKDIAVAVSVE